MFKVNCANEYCSGMLEYKLKKVANAAKKAGRVCKSCKKALKKKNINLKWIRDCPLCKEVIIYKKKGDFKRAKDINQMCRTCSDIKRRKSSYSGLKRACPKCKEELVYKTVSSCTRANKRGSLCKSCSMKLNGGFSDEAMELARLSKLGKKQTPEHISKRAAALKRKYNNSSFLGSLKHKEVMQNLGIWTNINGKTIGSILNNYNVPNSSFYKIIKNNKNITLNELNELCNKYVKNISTLELIISSEINLPHFNKKCHNDMGYRPDFKLNESIYLNADGLYWHSEKFTDKYYHFNMRIDFENRGLRIFQFRADEINDKINIIKSMINNALGKTTNRVGARKCVIKKVSTKCAINFLNENHIKGYMHSNHIGLYYNEMLISIMSYRIIKNTIKVDRFCSLTGWNISGGFSKLLKNIQSFYPKSSVHYWVDLRYGTGNFLLNQGFTLEKETLGWEWTDFNRTYNRLSCRAGMDDRRLSEKEHAKELGWSKIYDAGQRLYIKKS